MWSVTSRQHTHTQNKSTHLSIDRLHRKKICIEREKNVEIKKNVLGSVPLFHSSCDFMQPNTHGTSCFWRSKLIWLKHRFQHEHILTILYSWVMYRFFSILLFRSLSLSHTSLSHSSSCMCVSELFFFQFSNFK